jgi:hypothetical protein
MLLSDYLTLRPDQAEALFRRYNRGEKAAATKAAKYSMARLVASFLLTLILSVFDCRIVLLPQIYNPMLCLLKIFLNRIDLPLFVRYSSIPSRSWESSVEDHE